MARYGAGVRMNPNMFQTFDLGSAVQSGQQVQENRLRNQALADDQNQRQDMLKNRAKAQEIRTMYDTMPDQIAALERENMFEQADELRNSYIKNRKTEVDLLTTLRDSIDETNYKQFRSELLTSGAITPDMMPVEYSDDWFRKQKKEKLGKLNSFTVQSFENGAVMSRDYVTQDGKVREDLTGNWYDQDAADKEKSGSGAGGKDWSMKPADSNAIGRQIERVFGGFYDPETGQLGGLDPEQAARVQAVQEEAETIYNENRGLVPHGVAVTRAARRLRINVESYRDKAADNPLNLNFPE